LIAGMFKRNPYRLRIPLQTNLFTIYDTTMVF